MTYYVNLLPLPYTIVKRYGITNQAAIGLLYTPLGFGNIIVWRLAFRSSFEENVEERGGVWCPEDQLRPTMLSAAVFVPLSTLGIGIVTHYVSGRLGLVLNILCLFFNGLGIEMVASPSSAYVIDIMHSCSAESVAAYRGFRSLLISIGISAIAPAIQHYGILRTNAVCALIVWVGFGLLWLVIKHGGKDEELGRYSTAETN
ncbi:hypothetical protein L218DRAFT_472856 [Marasmius fiardii PR-910]|nr:hypothetical protein L218DRAFT_472856 [Marasmius fiardii PR-910]